MCCNLLQHTYHRVQKIFHSSISSEMYKYPLRQCFIVWKAEAK